MTKDELVRKAEYLVKYKGMFTDAEYIAEIIAIAEDYARQQLLQQTPCTTQLSCGCKKGQRGMITFAKDGDYCGNCGKLIPTT